MRVDDDSLTDSGSPKSLRKSKIQDDFHLHLATRRVNDFKRYKEISQTIDLIEDAEDALDIYLELDLEKE